MIKLLDKSVTDKIAAGEVVERPLSVIKELVENSIDAGADTVVVEIKKGGKDYIRVADNGCGIPDDETELAFKRHATSKISAAEDIDSILTLGFRGEALASIAAVSRLEMVSRTKAEKLGTCITIEGGKIKDHRHIGCDIGTTVVIRNLFYNTPARLKFMKSDNAESSAVTDFLSKMVLAYPHIKFRVINNENILFASPGTGNRLSCIKTVYGGVTAQKLIPVKYSHEGITVEGYISGSHESKTNRRHQIFFVNGRYVNSKIIDNAVKEAYEDKLFTGRFPIIYLFVSVAPGKLDVNIHPNKTEVRFDDEKKIETYITYALKNALKTESAIGETDLKPERVIPKTDININTEKTFHLNPSIEDNKDNKLADVFVKSNGHENTKREVIKNDTSVQMEFKNTGIYITKLLSTLRAEEQHDQSEFLKDKTSEYEKNNPDKIFDFTKLKIFSTVFGTYIVAADGDNLYFMDQHAAHERIYYEKLMSGFLSEENQMQQVMVPPLFELPPAAVSQKDAALEVLRKMGFLIEDFGPRTLKISGVPMFMELSEAEDFVKDFFDNVEAGDDFQRKHVIDRISVKACKAAVKAGDKLSEAEIKALIQELSQCDNPYNCPHGRPVFIRFSKYQIEKMFKRV